MSKKDKGKQKLKPKEEYKSKTKLSHSRFCKVYKIVGDTTYVVKKYYDSTHLRQGEEEYKVLDALKHCDNIVEVIEQSLVKDKVSLEFQQEYCELGSLYDMLAGISRLLYESEIRAIFFQIVKGIYQIHSKGYIHKNLTISNILLKANGVVKIGGFSQAKRKTDEHTIDKFSDYTPPLIKTDESIVMPMKTDIYSLGIILYELILKECPSRLLMNNSQFDYSDDENKVKSIEMSIKELLTKSISISDDRSVNDLCDLYESMVCKNEVSRADLCDIFTHPWMKVFSMQSIDEILRDVINESKLSRSVLSISNKDYFICTKVKSIDKIHSVLSKVYQGKCAENDVKHILYGDRNKRFLHIKLKKADDSDYTIVVIRGNIHCFNIKEDFAK